MSFFGKILVVLQMTLSILFMMFAAAVYSTHTNWRDQYLNQKKAAEKATSERNSIVQETTDQTTKMKQALDDETRRAQEAEAVRDIKTAELETSKQQAQNLQTQLQVAQRRAENALAEAKARHEEASQLREVNHVQTGLISDAETAKAKLNDELRKLRGELEIANLKNGGLRNQLSQYTAVLAKNGISADEAVDLASVIPPPPKIEGKVRTVRRPAKLGNSETLGISLGINDGVLKGHEMTVWRPGNAAGGRPRYLAKIRIVSTNPDSAVGEVIEETRNGAIQEGDNVSTKL